MRLSAHSLAFFGLAALFPLATAFPYMGQRVLGRTHVCPPTAQDGYAWVGAARLGGWPDVLKCTYAAPIHAEGVSMVADADGRGDVACSYSAVSSILCLRVPRADLEIGRRQSTLRYGGDLCARRPHRVRLRDGVPAHRGGRSRRARRAGREARAPRRVLLRIPVARRRARAQAYLRVLDRACGRPSGTASPLTPLVRRTTGISPGRPPPPAHRSRAACAAPRRRGRARMTACGRAGRCLHVALAGTRSE
jgi:hypothetical protein